MSKELEAFGLIKRTCELYIESRSYLKGSDIIENQINEALNTIKNHLEAIDNAEPSEALKKLEMLSDCAEAMKEEPSSNWIEYADNETELDYQLWRAYEDLKSALLKAEKEHKALEIIKEKNVDILDVKLYENYEHYCRAKEDSRLRKDWWLTKEEFNLLKEVLE